MDETRRRIFDDLIAAARAGNGTLDATTCPYPLHELLTHLVAEHALLLHGSNHTTLELLEPRPAPRLRHGAAGGRGVQTTASGRCSTRSSTRERCEVSSPPACHVGRRRLYTVCDAQRPRRSRLVDAREPSTRCQPGRASVASGVVKWVRAEPVRPVLRVLVGPEDFRCATRSVAATPEQFRRIRACEAKASAQRQRRVSPADLVPLEAVAREVAAEWG